VVPGDPRPQGLGRGRIAPVPGDPRHARRRRCGGLFGQGRRRTGRHFDDAPRASGASTACAEQHEGAERRRDDRCRERAGSRCSGCARRGTAAATAGRTHAPPSHAPESARRRNRRRGGRPPRFRVSPGGPCSTTWASHD
jgi:hypothetical protein